jgi:SAM-dependent methyltransferase
MDYPFRIEQCVDDGTIIKPQMIQKCRDAEIYEEGYHFFDFVDERPDWNALKETYQKRRWRNMRKVGVQSAIDSDPKLTALDIGCGTGGLVDLLNQQGYDAIGIDFSEFTIQTAKFYFPHLKFEVADLDAILKRREKFDLITLSHVLEHIRYDEDFLVKIKSIMKPNSLLYIECPWFDSNIFKSRHFWYRQIDHYREYTKSGLYRIVSGTGYEIIGHEDSLNDEGNEPYQFILARIP